MFACLYFLEVKIYDVCVCVCVCITDDKNSAELIFQCQK